jgi:hypothetical protein
MHRLNALAVAAAGLLTVDAGAQVPTDPRVPPPSRSVSLAGPRFGVSMLSPGIVDSLAARDIDVSSFITQFGWQLETQIYSLGNGPTVLMELVGLVGGLEQGAAIPSVSWLTGLRSASGAEFGIGPNLTPAGPALVFAAGFTQRSGAMLFPINLSVVPSKAGTRISFLVGYTIRSERPPLRLSLPLPRPAIEPNVPYPCFPNAQLCDRARRVPVKANPPHVPARVEGVGVCWSQGQPCRRPPP